MHSVWRSSNGFVRSIRSRTSGFASVYKQFDDLADFEAEVVELQKTPRPTHLRPKRPKRNARNTTVSRLRRSPGNVEYVTSGVDTRELQ